VRAMQAGRDVLIELPLAATLEDARRIVALQRATDRKAFVDMFSRFGPASQQLRQVVADQRYGPLRVLEIEGRTALLWEGYDLGLDTLALDMMHADFDLVTSLLGQPSTVQVTGTGGDRPRAGLPVRPGQQPHRTFQARPALELTLDVHQRLTQAGR
jgi:UDP-N-acetylglucosamine 3-dehydrogenase